MMKMLKRILMLCLCLALLADCAGAEETTELYSGDGDNSLWYDCALPDGRIVLSGKKEAGSEYSNGQVWVVCLNPDRTVSWEYAEPETGDYWGPMVTMLRDGTIAMVCRRFWAGGDDITVRFLTPDGTPVDKKIDIPTGGGSLWPHDVSRDYMVLERQIEVEGRAEVESEMEIRDWDGNIVSKYYSFGEDSGFYYMEEEPDGLLMYGYDAGKHAKVLKREGPVGEILWETTMDFQWQDSDWAMFSQVRPTPDGGYVGWIRERKNDPEGEKHIAVKLDARGKVQWMRAEGADLDDRYCDITVYGEKIVMYTSGKTAESDFLAQPRKFLWFDLEGKELGTTELALKPENFPVLQQFLDGNSDGGEKIPLVDRLEMIPMADGLWANVLACVQVNPVQPDTTDPEWKGYDAVLARIPEP